MTDTNGNAPRRPQPEDRSGLLVTFHAIHEPGCPTDPVARRRTLAAGHCDGCQAVMLEVGVDCTDADGRVTRGSMAEAILRADELVGLGRQRLAVARTWGHL